MGNPGQASSKRTLDRLPPVDPSYVVNIRLGQTFSLNPSNLTHNTLQIRLETGGTLVTSTIISNLSPPTIQSSSCQTEKPLNLSTLLVTRIVRALSALYLRTLAAGQRKRSYTVYNMGTPTLNHITEIVRLGILKCIQNWWHHSWLCSQTR